MPKIELQGTQLTFSIVSLAQDGYFLTTEIGIENEFVRYFERSERFTREELNEFIFSLYRLLAGAYAHEYAVPFEKKGMAVDLYAYTKDGEEASREERRDNDCVMAIRLLMRSQNSEKYLGGVYSFLLHRKEIETFANGLRTEFDAAVTEEQTRGEYLFVGVSPRGYRGCNYWYLDKSGTVKPGDCVWARMGRHNTLQILYVDSVRWCSDSTAPYDPSTVKQIVKIATEEEIEAFRE